MTGKRDRQRGRVYAWENRVVAPRDPTFVKYQAAQAMVDAIWSDMGLRYPPAVEPLPRQASVTIASADRLSIFLPERTPSWCLLHEIAHAMTSTADGSSDEHGEVFVAFMSSYSFAIFGLNRANFSPACRMTALSLPSMPSQYLLMPKSAWRNSRLRMLEI